MKPALALLARMPNVKIIPTIEEGPSPTPAVRVGRIEAHIPPLDPSDIVYACGSPRMVDALAGFVDSAGATFYADPFESSGPDEPTGLLGMLKTLVPARRNLPERGEDRPAQRLLEPNYGDAAYEADDSLMGMHSRIPLQPEPPRSAPARAQGNPRPVMRERGHLREVGTP